MNRIIAAVCILFFSLSVSAGEEKWSFIQSIGGMTIGTPVKVSKGWMLPINADVSGLTTVTVKPATLNSTLVCRHVQAMIVEFNIYLTLISDAADPKSEAVAACGPALLGEIAAGQYNVFYRASGESPVKIGEAMIK